MTECLTKIMDKTGLSKDEAVDFIARTDKLIEQGISPEKILDDFLEFKEKRASYIAKMKNFNQVRDAVIVKDLKDRVVSYAKPENAYKLGPITLSNPLIESVLNITRDHYHHRMQLRDKYAQAFDKVLEGKGLLDYAKNPTNSKNIYLEMAALGESVNRSSGVTGDPNAFQIAKAFKTKIQNKLFQRQAAAGATTWYRKDFIFPQKYNKTKIQDMSDGRFIKLMSQVKYDKLDSLVLEARQNARTQYEANYRTQRDIELKKLQEEDPKFKSRKGYKQSRQQAKAIREKEIRALEEKAAIETRNKELIRLKREMESGNYVDPDNPFDELSNSVNDSSLAEYLGKSRRIEFTPEQYAEFGDELFDGNNFFERANSYINNATRTTADLELFGSKPADNFNKLIDSLIAESKYKKGTEFEDIYLQKGKNKSVLESNAFQSTRQEQSQFVKVMFGQKVDNEDFAKWMSTLRGLDAVSKLGGAVITSISDMGNRAVMDTLVSGNQKQVFPALIDATDSLIKVMGKDGYGVIEDTVTGIETSLDNLKLNLRFEDAMEVSGSSRTAKVREGVDYASRKLFKLNMLEAVTQAQQQASFHSATSQWARLKDLSVDQLNDFARNELHLFGITPEDWDFLRANAVRKNNYGQDVMSPTYLNNQPLSVFEKYAGSSQQAVVMAARDEIVAKWERFLRKEATTATLMPDVVDQWRITGGTQAGTLGGEARRFAMMYKSYALGWMARVLLPVMKYGDEMTQVQYLGAMTSLTMLSFTLKDLAKGRTPRDFTKPENMMGVTGAVFGFPFLDQLTFVAGQDNVQASGLYDIVAGPVIGDGVETTARVMNLLKDDDPDYAKFTARTFLPTVPFRNHWATTGFYNRLYNETMSRIDPNFPRKYEALLEKTGQKEFY